MRIGWIGIFLILLSGCSIAPRATLQTKLPDTGQPALHAVQDARLRTLMQQMNNLMFDNLRTELDIDRDRSRHARQIGESAAAMAKTVDDILANRTKLNLRPGEDEAFVALAIKLRKLAQKLQQEALNNQVDTLPKTLDQISLTCSSCHQLFRDTHL